MEINSRGVWRLLQRYNELDDGYIPERAMFEGPDGPFELVLTAFNAYGAFEVKITEDNMDTIIECIHEYAQSKGIEPNPLTMSEDDVNNIFNLLIHGTTDKKEIYSKRK